MIEVISMFVLLILIISGIGAALFATQNTQGVSITFAGYTFTDIPMYLIVLCTLLIGISISWIISLAGSISSSLTIHGKENAIKETKKQINDLTKQVHELELENAKLMTETGKSPVDDESL